MCGGPAASAGSCTAASGDRQQRQWMTAACESARHLATAFAAKQLLIVLNSLTVAIIEVLIRTASCTKPPAQANSPRMVSHGIKTA